MARLALVGGLQPSTQHINRNFIIRVYKFLEPVPPPHPFPPNNNNNTTSSTRQFEIRERGR